MLVLLLAFSRTTAAQQYTQGARYDLLDTRHDLSRPADRALLHYRQPQAACFNLGLMEETRVSAGRGASAWLSSLWCIDTLLSTASNHVGDGLQPIGGSGLATEVLLPRLGLRRVTLRNANFIGTSQKAIATVYKTWAIYRWGG
ncbi:MAG: hypothetical protein IPI07_18875 [Flavobacteriales bacterium]|nr:hypothetical protein [Flavobacteriales bacterium]